MTSTLVVTAQWLCRFRHFNRSCSFVCCDTVRISGYFAGEQRYHCWKAAGTHGTHYGRHCEPLSGKSALNCWILHIQSQKFSGDDTWYVTPAGAPVLGVLDPDTNFRLARQRAHCSCFTKWPLVRIRISFPNFVQDDAEKLQPNRPSLTPEMSGPRAWELGVESPAELLVSGHVQLLRSLKAGITLAQLHATTIPRLNSLVQTAYATP